MIVRPAILDGNKWSKSVKGIIKDINGKIAGVVLSKDDMLLIEFFGVISNIIIYNRKTNEFRLEKEYFPTDPRIILEKIILEKK